MAKEIQKRPGSEHKALAIYGTANDITVAAKSEAARRKEILRFIASQLHEGTDFGIIKDADSGWTSPKKVLYKPGAEKICLLFKLRAEFKRDDETLSMIPSTIRDKESIFAYVCRLYNKETLVSEGRGICTAAEKKGKLNTAVKIGEKRAHLDAVLRLGFSDSFTQDFGDPESEVGDEKKQTVVDDRERIEAGRKTIRESFDRLKGKIKFSKDIEKGVKEMHKMDLPSIENLYTGLKKEIDDARAGVKVEKYDEELTEKRIKKACKSLGWDKLSFATYVSELYNNREWEKLNPAEKMSVRDKIEKEAGA